MDDIVERLQEHEYICCGGHDFALRCKSCVLHIEAANEIERLRALCAIWVNGVADAVEPMGFCRLAASGPADLLPGLDHMWDEIKRLRTAGDALVAAIRNHDLREEHIKAWEESRRG